MMTMNGQTVNVKRTELLKALQTNFEIHKKEYEELVIEYRRKLIRDLSKALELASLEGTAALSESELQKLRVQFNYPPNYANYYTDVIEMLEMSVDEFITLDHQHFKMYIKNQWSWTDAFNTTKMNYVR